MSKDWGTPLRIINNWASIASIMRECREKAGFALGSYKEADLGPEGVVRMQLVNVTGKQADFLAMDPLRYGHRMAPRLKHDENGQRVEGTGNIGGFQLSELNDYLKHSALENADPVLKQLVDRLWIPSFDELYGDEYERFQFFWPDTEATIRGIWGREDIAWWLRDQGGGLSSYRYVASDANEVYTLIAMSHIGLDVVVGFSLVYDRLPASVNGERS